MEKAKAEILWVEDDFEFRNALAITLREAGYSVTDCADRETALQILSEKPSLFDIVLTDIHLTPKDSTGGRELAKQISEIRSERGYDAAPLVLCITGYYIDVETQHRVEQGGARYVLKGANDSEYIRTIELLLLELKELRGDGPLFRITHTKMTGTNGFGCVVGEEVASVELAHRNQVVAVRLTDTPRRIFDYLSRYACTYPQTTKQIVKGLTQNNAFYHEWFSLEKTTPDSIKMAVRRIRQGLKGAFAEMHLNLNPKDVLVSHLPTSEVMDGDESEQDDFNELEGVKEFGKKKATKDNPKAYKLHARIELIHS